MIFDLTYKSSGGFVSEFFESTKYIDDWREYIDIMRVFYDFFYIFIVIVILSEITSGIIIDTFAQLRLKNEQEN